MKIIAISDLHGYLPEPKDIPEVDVICIAGDIVPLDIQRAHRKCRQWYKNIFVPWAKSLNCKKVILIAGNHDFFFETFIPEEDDKIIYLLDDSVEVDGKIFYGTPWISGLPSWAFNKTEEELEEVFSHIPNVCDVLITHMPPAIGDVGTVLGASYNYGSNYSSEALTEALKRRDIHYTFCGHVHSGAHSPTPYYAVGERMHYVMNVSIKDEQYKLYPLYFEVYDI